MTTRTCILFIWIFVIVLLGLGLIMVTSTSLWTPEGANYAMLQKQITFACVGVFFALVLSSINYNIWGKFIWWGFILSFICLALCYVPGIRKGINGEFRWIGLGGVQFQPSECAKIIVMMTLAYWYSCHKGKAHHFWKGFIVPSLILFIPVVAIFGEKDMGTAASLATAGFCVMFIAGTRWFYLLIPLIGGSAAFCFMVMTNDNRLARLRSYKNLEETKLSTGLQQWRSLKALSDGGLSGTGLGCSSQKHGYLPYAHTDFIFAPLGEELGFFGTSLVLFLFFCIVFFGVTMAMQVRSTFGKLLSIGIIFCIFWPAMLNISVVTASLPNSGLPLPFISYGGTNLLFTLGAIGLLTSIQRFDTTAINGTFLTRRRLSKETSPIHLPL